MCETKFGTHQFDHEGENGYITLMMETAAPNGSVLAVSQEYNITLGMYYFKKIYIYSLAILEILFLVLI